MEAQVPRGNAGHETQAPLGDALGHPWNPPAGACPPPPFGFHLTFARLSMIQGALALLAVCAIFPLLATGGVFGAHSPGNLPPWAGVVLLILLCKVVAAPIKALRRGPYCRAVDPTRPWWAWHPFAEVGPAPIGVAVAGFCLRLADRYIPGCHETLRNLPVFLPNVADSVQQWRRQA